MNVSAVGTKHWTQRSHWGEGRKNKLSFVFTALITQGDQSRALKDLCSRAASPARISHRCKAPQQRATPRVSIHQNGAFYGPSKDNAACSGGGKWRQTLQTQIKQRRRRARDIMFGVIWGNQPSSVNFMKGKDARPRVRAPQFTPGVLKYSFHTAV